MYLHIWHPTPGGEVAQNEVNPCNISITTSACHKAAWTFTGLWTNGDMLLFIACYLMYLPINTLEHLCIVPLFLHYILRVCVSVHTPIMARSVADCRRVGVDGVAWTHHTNQCVLPKPWAARNTGSFSQLANFWVHMCNLLCGLSLKRSLGLCTLSPTMHNRDWFSTKNSFIRSMTLSKAMNLLWKDTLQVFYRDVFNSLTKFKYI